MEVINIRYKRIINNELSSELTHVDLKTQYIYNDEPEKSVFENAKEIIKFDIHALDTVFYKNELIISILAMIISITCLIFKDFFALINPIAMILLLILFSSNKVEITNNRYLDVSMWNCINSLNMLLKSLNVFIICKKYGKLNDFFTKIFIYSLILSGIPAFNGFIILIFFGLLISYIIAFSNKDIYTIKSSIESISSSYYIYMIISMIIFSPAFKSSAISLTAFTLVLTLKYFNNIIKNYNIKFLDKDEEE